jgi:WD40 repeat protein/uncharacterized caspase-like protein
VAIAFQLPLPGQAPFIKRPKLILWHGTHGQESGNRSAVALPKRSIRRGCAYPAIILFLALSCLYVSSQAYVNSTAGSDSLAAIVEYPVRGIAMPDDASGNSTELPELVVQSGHSGTIMAMAFSRQGLLATASTDGTVKLWNGATRQLLRTLSVSRYWVYSVSFSPDGKLLATGSGDNTVRIWEMATARQLNVFQGHGHAVKVLVFSSDGARLASGSSRFNGELPNSLISVWNVSSGDRLFQIDRLGEVLGLSFSGPNRLIASIGGEINAWDIDNDLPVEASNFTAPTIAGVHAGTVRITSADGRHTALARGTSFELYDQANETKVQQPRPLAVRALNFSPDGKLLAVGEADGSVTLWDTKSGQPTRTFQGQEIDKNGIIHSVGFTPDAKYVFSAAWNSGVWMWDLKRSDPPRELHSALKDLQVEQESTGQRMLAEMNPSPGPSAPPSRLTAIVDGQEPSPMTEEVYTTAIGPTGRLMAYAGYSWSNAMRGSFFRIIDWKTLQAVDYVLDVKGAGISARALSLSPNGETLAIGYSNGTLDIRDIAAHRFVFTKEAHSGAINAIAFSPTGHIIASADTDNTVKLWDPSSGELRLSLTGHSAPVLCVTFSNDGTKVVSGAADSEIIVWDARTGGRLQTLVGHSSAVNTLAFSPQGNLLVSGSEDGVVRFWAGSSYRLLASAVSFGKNQWLVFNPEGFFDGTQPAWQLVPFRFPSEPVRLYQPEQFFNQFYQPNLLADVLAKETPLLEILREQGDSRASINLSRYRNSSLPNLRIAGPAPGEVSSQRIVQIIIEAQDTGSGLRDLRVFRNQSLVHLEHGDLNADPDTKTFRLVVPVKISAGENTISAYVFNRDNVKSKDSSIVITGATTLKRRGKAYIVAIGINQYSNPGFNLQYAKADAQALSDALRRSLTELKAYDQVVPVLMVDAQASKKNILLALQRLAGLDASFTPDVPAEIQALQPVEPEDAVFIYFAGHGAARGDRYYLIPNDLGYEGDPKQIDMQGRLTILENSLSDLDLDRVLETIDSNRILLVIDACQSGQVLESEEKRRGPMNSRGLAQLAYEKGAYILAAAQSYQAALEFKKLGHGILTYVLVEEGLDKYAADFAPTDGIITAAEWLQYATQQVPAEIQLMEQEHTRNLGRGVDYGETAITGQAPRSYFRRDTDEVWIVAEIPNSGERK